MANSENDPGTWPEGGNVRSKKVSHLRPNRDVPRHWLKAYRTQVASATSSVAAHVVAYPMFSVIRRLQTVDSNARFRDVVMNTYRTEGLRGFYNGKDQFKVGKQPFQAAYTEL